MNTGTPWPYPLWIAHRGAGKLAPENTLAAFRLGAAHGYSAFECDVKLSRDGVPFLLHDATLDRTSDRRGRAADLDWSELSRVDAGGWHSRAYAGEPPPSLEGIARFCLRGGHALNIEVKPTPGSERITGETVAREARRLWAAAPAAPAAAAARPLPLLSSFKPEALAGARDGAPELPRALLLDSLREGWFEQAQSLGCVAVVAMYALFDAAVVQRLHDAGLRALAYTVNDPSVAQHLLVLGLDGLITDAVDRLSPHGARQLLD